MTRRLLRLTACTLGVAAAPAEASCLPATEREHIRRADAVFTGRVLSVRADGGRATFRALTVRKGAVRRGSSVRVHATYPSSITIIWPPQVGERWRVYADRLGRRWTTNDCMGTLPA